MRKRRYRFKQPDSEIPQSDLEGQDAASGRYTGWPNVLPRDYPADAKPTRPRYDPWPRTMPDDYPRAPHKPARPVARRLGRADLRLMEQTKNGAEIVGSIKPKPYVLSNFDARPINCIDFVWTNNPTDQAVLPGDTFTTNFNVPEGRVAILRRLNLTVFMSVVGAARNAGSVPQSVILASYSINGNAVEGFNNIDVSNAISGFSTGFVYGGMKIPLYILAPPASRVTLTITNQTVANDMSYVAPLLTGNLLLAEGVNPTSEPGTQWPLPTRTL